MGCVGDGLGGAWFWLWVGLAKKEVLSVWVEAGGGRKVSLVLGGVVE